MKILLINPQTPDMIRNKEYYTPPSLLYLAAVLQKAGSEVNILDLNTKGQTRCDDSIKFYEDIIIDKISDFKPTFIGIGCLFSGHFPLVANYSQLIKKRFGNLPIVIGGIHPTIFHVEILTNCPSIDFIILGEGEESIVLLASALKENDFDGLKNIDGLAYRWNDRVVVNPKTRFIGDLDEIPFPAYDLINLKDYYHDTSNWLNPKNLPINTSISILSSRS